MVKLFVVVKAEVSAKIQFPVSKAAVKIIGMQLIKHFNDFSRNLVSAVQSYMLVLKSSSWILTFWHQSLFKLYSKSV